MRAATAAWTILIFALCLSPVVGAAPTETDSPTSSPEVLIDREPPLNVSGNGSVIRISGTSNREDGTEVVVEILDESGRPVAIGSATLDGATGTWSTTLNVSRLSDGAYRLVAQTAHSSTSQPLVVPPPAASRPESDTPAETPWRTETDTATSTSTPTVRASPVTTRRPSPTESASPTETVGSGLVSSPLLILVVLGVVFWVDSAS